MTLEGLRALESTIKKEVDSFEVRFKDESRLMRALGLLMCPFNGTFMTNFTTTLGSVVYFPSRAAYESNPDRSIVTLAHEFVHIHDSREHGPRFQLRYAAPQIWAVPLLLLHGVLGSPLPICMLLLGYVLLAWTLGGKPKAQPWFLGLLAVLAVAVLVTSVLAAGWWTLALLGALGCLGPWTSAGRTHWEMRGYTMNIAIYMWVRNALVPEETVRSYVYNFTGPDYWFMCRDSTRVEDLFAASIRATLERKLQLERPYSVIYDYLVAQGRASPTFSG